MAELWQHAAPVAGWLLGLALGLLGLGLALLLLLACLGLMFAPGAQGEPRPHKTGPGWWARWRGRRTAQAERARRARHEAA